MLRFGVSNDIVACAGAVHLPWGLVFSHLQDKTVQIIFRRHNRKIKYWETHTLVRQLEQVLFGNFAVNGKVHAGRSATVAA